MSAPLDLYRETRLYTEDLRGLEAQLFRRVAYALRQGLAAGGIPLARALADERRLWTGVMTAVADDRNQLPPALRQGLADLARTVLAELQKPMASVAPETLADINTRIAEALECR